MSVIFIYLHILSTTINILGILSFCKKWEDTNICHYSVNVIDCYIVRN